MKSLGLFLAGLFCIYALSGCRCCGKREKDFGRMYNESGSVDVDGSAANGKDFHLIAGYAGSAKVIIVPVGVAASDNSDKIGGDIEGGWNDTPGITQMGHCQGHPSVLRFPPPVDDIFILNEDGVIQRLGPQPKVLSNGMTITRRAGNCPLPTEPEP